MDEIKVERFGGLAGVGLPGSHVKSRGHVALSALSAKDQAKVAALFEAEAADAPDAPDAFYYHLTRDTPKGPQTVRVAHDALPEAVEGCVVDELD